MTIDERVAEFMKGWHIGTMPHLTGAGLVDHYKPKGAWTEDMARGYVAGCAERELTEKRQREWLESLCPHCQGDPAWRSTNAVGKAGMLFGCTVCHGTGKSR